jgi:meso-butanediol dehydrogenase/(S,S)-butanediol dehydrogenase/diacetyl reductase
MSSETKVAIITGGGAGIGKACALRFAREGFGVVIADISAEDGQRTRELIQSEGGQAIFRGGDVSQEADCQAWAQAALDTWGGIDVLVANAGVQTPGHLFEASDEDWGRTIGVNLKGVALSCKAVLPAMVEQGSGALVLISSVNALLGVGGGGMLIYDASKAGVLALTRSLAIAHGQDGIRVNAICPGVTVTEFHEQRAAERGQTPEELRAGLKGHALLGKPAEPHQIASAVYFMASEDASHITGQYLVVDGGLTVMSHPL